MEHFDVKLHLQDVLNGTNEYDSPYKTYSDALTLLANEKLLLIIHSKVINHVKLKQNLCIYIYIYICIHVLLKRMAHSLFIIFFLVFSYFLIKRYICVCIYIILHTHNFITREDTFWCALWALLSEIGPTDPSCHFQR